MVGEALCETQYLRMPSKARHLVAMLTNGTGSFSSTAAASNLSHRANVLVAYMVSDGDLVVVILATNRPLGF